MILLHFTNLIGHPGSPVEPGMTMLVKAGDECLTYPDLFLRRYEILNLIARGGGDDISLRTRRDE